jgi:hypothetical protein
MVAPKPAETRSGDAVYCAAGCRVKQPHGPEKPYYYLWYRSSAVRLDKIGSWILRMPEPSERPPIASAPLSVVLLAQNDALEIDEVVTAWVSHLKELGREHEILLVDDGSSDNTPVQADKLAERFSSVRVLRQAAPRGTGAALHSGIAAAQYPLLFYTTCDKQYHPADLARLLETIDKVDLVTGYRVGRPLPGWLIWWDRLFRLFVRVLFGISQEPVDCWLGWAGWPRRWLGRWVFGVRVRDQECAFRLFRRYIFARIPIQTRDFAHVEILAKANFLGCWMAEVPVTCLPGRAKKQARSREAARAARQEIRDLFRRPDFGPVELPPIVTTTVIRASEEAAVFGQPLTFALKVYPLAVGRLANPSYEKSGIGNPLLEEPAGAVSLLVNGVERLRTVLEKGEAAFTATDLNAGVNTVSASYEGNSTFAASVSNALSCFVKRAPTATALSLPAGEPVQGREIILTARVSPASPVAALPTGPVRFQKGATVLGESTLNEGVASFPISSLSAGTHPLNAAYDGDGNFAASVSHSVDLTIPPEPVSPAPVPPKPVPPEPPESVPPEPVPPEPVPPVDPGLPS